MSAAPTVSIIMNCYNSDTYLRESIDSVYAQTFTDWEIIFYDNASTDRSAEIAKSYDGKLKYFRSTETISLGAARNEAIAHSSGTFIAFLDCDDIWFPKKLEIQLPFFKDSEVGLVFSNTIFFNGKGDEKPLYPGRPFYVGSCFRELLADYFLSMETVILRRTALNQEEIWFDPDFNMIEEADLFRRIGMHWKLAGTEEPLAKWRVHSASWTWKKTELYAIETTNMLKKYSTRIANFDSVYQKEIKVLKSDMAVLLAKTLWRQGAGSKARAALLPFFTRPKVFAMCLLSFLPAQKFESVVNRLRGTIVPST